MSAAAALAWLEERCDDAPADLREGMRRAVEAAEGEGEGPGAANGAQAGAAALLADAAFLELAASLRLSGRAAAAPLLSADALLTHAYEAAAGADALDALAASHGAAALATLLAAAARPAADAAGGSGQRA